MAGSLGRRPQAIVLSVEDLVERVRRGEVRVPKFQRRLNWRARDIKLLFDSILHGYPVGSLLFWKRDAPPDVVPMGPVTISAPAVRDALWVVDGQQRIASLVGALLHPDPVRGRDDFALGFDLARGEFAKAGAVTSPFWMPLNVILDTRRLLEWLDAYGQRSTHPEHVGIAHSVARTLRDYQLPAYVVEADDEQVVRDVFGRVNSAGRKLKEDEIFDALAGSAADEAPSSLAAISDGLAELGFGTFERSWILKAIIAIAGLDITRHASADLPRAELPRLRAAAERALKAVVIFLRNDAGILHASLLPYGLVVPVLAKFFHLHPDARPRSRELLTRWLWRGAITGQHRGESSPEVRSMLNAVTQNEEGSVQKLIATGVPAPSDKPYEFAPFEWRTARTKVEANALLSLGPRHYLTGEPLDVAGILSAEGPSAFQRLAPYRFKTIHERRKLKRSPVLTIAGRIFHPVVEGMNAWGVVAPRRSGPEWLEFVRSHALPPAEMLALLTAAQTGVFEGRGVAFLEAREKLLEDLVKDFMASKAKWTESDRPSIEALIVPDTEGPGA